MGKRKGRTAQVSETLNQLKVDEEDKQEEEEEAKGEFFACYLLTSLSPRFKGHTYIGFTVNPCRRIRQHNGEIRCGAWRTKNKRPWEMVLCIYGFPTNVAALQFEWAWQHPVESLAVRKAAVGFKSLSGLANKIKLAYTMLTLPAWQSLDLTVNFFSTKYTKHSAGCPSLPGQMKVQFRSMDELPCYGGEDWNAYENNELKNDDVECDDENSELKNDDVECDEENSELKNDDVECDDKNSDGPCYGNTSSNANNSDCIQPFEQNSPIWRENSNGPFCLNDSPDRGVSLYTSSLNGGRMEALLERKDVFGLIDDYSIDSDMPKRKQVSMKTDCDKPQSTTNNSTVACEVEVIDVFTPSPGINSRKKKMGVFSSVFPDVIDLTNSPIYV